jgi:hypothetical protein
MSETSYKMTPNGHVCGDCSVYRRRVDLLVARLRREGRHDGVGGICCEFSEYWSVCENSEACEHYRQPNGNSGQKVFNGETSR